MNAEAKIEIAATIGLSKVELYTIRSAKRGEWAYITIDESSGLFLALSSYGTFGYCWTAIGNETLKQFLASLNFGYFFSKVAEQTRGQVFSPGKTVEGIKRLVLERSRNGEITKSQARGAWEAAEASEGNHDAHEFFDELLSDADILAVYDGDYGDIERRERDPQCVGFWEHIWPVFLEAIR